MRRREEHLKESKKPVLHRGKQVYIGDLPLYEHEYSDMLLSHMLKAWLPLKYKERVEPINIQDIDSEKLSPEVAR
jgi:hypothetical protein